jgi:hypothetical protein|tara:strand:- start:351 stop:551 length:201 start_codon:yes stop_codon:yes gene_type:complete
MTENFDVRKWFKNQYINETDPTILLEDVTKLLEHSLDNNEDKSFLQDLSSLLLEYRGKIDDTLNSK